MHGMFLSFASVNVFTFTDSVHGKDKELMINLVVALIISSDPIVSKFHFPSKKLKGFSEEQLISGLGQKI
jgi:hypothetical protein